MPDKTYSALMIVSAERDRLKAVNADLLTALEGTAFHIQTLTSAMPPEYQKGDQVVLRKARAAINKARK